MKNIAVLFGGKSPEYEVSVITGVQAITNIKKEERNIFPVYVSKDGCFYTHASFTKIETFKDISSIPEYAREIYFDPQFKGSFFIKGKSIFEKAQKVDIDVALLCFHGGLGEFGGIQSLFELLEIPYTGSGILGSTLGMDKVVMKQILTQNNISNTDFLYFYKNDENIFEKVQGTFNFPIFVKPACSGSSIGVTKARNEEELKNGVELAFIFDQKIIVEQGIEGFREINISVMGNENLGYKASLPEEVFAKDVFLNYEEKYVGEGNKSKGMASTKRQLPANISEGSTKMLQDIAMNAFKVLNAEGLARIDFLFNEKTNEYFLIEINTIPGSLAFYLWEGSGLKYSDMLEELMKIGIDSFENKKKLTRSFESNILG